MSKFDDRLQYLISLKLEAGVNPGVAQDQDFGEQGVGSGSEDLQQEEQPQAEPGDGPVDPSEDVPTEEDDLITSPEEWELGKLAMRALLFDPNSFKIDPKVFEDFEKEKDAIKVLGYVEKVINKQEKGDQRNKFGHVRAGDSEQGGELEIPQLQGKSIVDKMRYFNQKLEGEAHMDHGRRVFWTRLILNAMKYPGNDYNLVPDELTPETMKHVFDKLKYDFNYDTRGMFHAIKGSEQEGDGWSGPGTF